MFRFVRWLPFNANGMALPNIILVRDRIYGEDAHVLYGLLKHEETHQKQYKRMGFWTFVWKYITNGRVRAQLEAEAYAAELSFYMDAVPYSFSVAKMIDTYAYNIRKLYYPFPFRYGRPSLEEIKRWIIDHLLYQ